MNVPESFNVLVRELKGLGLDVELLGGQGEVVEPGEEGFEPRQLPEVKEE
jgi:hypothetical protein